MDAIKTVGSITIDYSLCVNCKICYNVCPLDVYSWDAELNLPVVSYPDECYHCGVCEIDCPSVCIDVQLPVHARLVSV
ncbi:2-oxoglutarate ferredoxin oxidoreductase subunit delta [Anaerolineae bacterium]|nr:2-oxoglutarate ferredoxin oxidoreductase subunit delta [Anaerolineae bacterium]